MKPFPGAIESLSEILSLLRAQSILYQTAHWLSQGKTFYSDHLLFQRLYESVEKQIDSIAEKAIGYFGPAAVDPFHHTVRVAYQVRKKEGSSNVSETLLGLEHDLQTLLKETYDLFKANSMPLGLDDWLMATANEHDSNIYLLQQAVGWEDLGDKTKAASLHNIKHPQTAEGYFFLTPKKRETREFAETKAVSNVVQVGKAVAEFQGDKRVEKLVDKTPPTPSEVVKKPGGKAVSTLNRLVVETEDKGVKPALRTTAPLMPKESSLDMSAWLEDLDRR